MNRLSIVVQTCDKYFDLWGPFYTLFGRYWHDCPFPIYHVSETKVLNLQKVTPVTTGNLEWSARLLAALNQIESRYVLVLLDDYFLLKKVDDAQMQKCLEILDSNPNAAYLRIFPVPGPDLDYPGFANVGKIDKTKPYAITTQATIWNVEILKSFLVSSENVWQLEIEGSKRATNLPYDFLSLKINHKRKAETGNYPYTYLCTAVYKGKWMKEAIDLCKKENIELDLSYRGVENSIDRFYRLHYYQMPLIIKQVLDFIK